MQAPEKKKKILIFVDWYLPGFKAGGPIKSVSSVVSCLKNDFDFLVITTDTDAGDTVPYTSVPSDTWVQVNGSTQVFYASKAFLNRKNLSRLVRTVSYDAIYLNSFFSFYFSVVPLLLLKQKVIQAPVLIAPRGMLGKGALQLKATKKRVFILLSRLIGLQKNITWHATSLQEKEEITAVFGNRAKIVTVPNLQPDQAAPAPPAAEKKAGELKLFFLSRISEKKNLYFALQLLSGAGKAQGISFDIYGPVEDENYWKKCLRLIEELNDRGVAVRYRGAVPNSRVKEVIASAHFLLLPTLNENYGHAIVEAMISGKPVIISDQTPWRDLEKKNAGWDIPLDDRSRFEAVLRKCYDMDNNAYRKLAGATIRYAAAQFSQDEVTEDTKKMFNDLK